MFFDPLEQAMFFVSRIVIDKKAWMADCVLDYQIVSFLPILLAADRLTSLSRFRERNCSFFAIE